MGIDYNKIYDRYCKELREKFPPNDDAGELIIKVHEAGARACVDILIMCQNETQKEGEA